MSPERGFDYRKQPTFPGWGARREWPPLNPIPMDPNTYTYVSVEHLTEEEEPCEDAPGIVTGLSGETPDPVFITATGPRGVYYPTTYNGHSWGAPNWPTANLAAFFPFQVVETYQVVVAFLTNGATVSGNLDIGVYNVAGTRLAHLGSTAQAGVSATQSAALSVSLSPARYYIALAFDNTTSTYRRDSGGSVLAAASGMFTQTSAFPLPATATFATSSATIGIPAVGIGKRSTI